MMLRALCTALLGTTIVLFGAAENVAAQTTTTGTAAFSIYYDLPANGNQVAIGDGGTLTFPQTVINSNVTATITVVNTGTANGMVQSASVSGAGFQLVNLPVLPTTLTPNSRLDFGVNYAPTAVGTNTGTLQVTAGGKTVTIQLTGTAIISDFTYQLIVNGTTTTISPNQTVSLPDTPVGQTTPFLVQAINNSDIPLQISGINVSGPFAITSAPFVPATVGPGSSITVAATFAPTTPGPATGYLIIGSDTFGLTGNGVGSQLIFSYTVGGASTTVITGGTIVFNPAQVGQTEQAQFTIRNTGTEAQTINNIGISGNANGFSLTGVPTLPVTIAAGQTINFSISFTPVVTGFVTATLTVGTQNFSLSGSGTAPAALPAYEFSGVSGTVPAMTQESIGLALTQPYPLDINGTLQMIVNAEPAASDPAVQFSTGGRSVTFTIPANTKQAVFADGSQQIGFQTGTVASTITFTPAFATTAGLNLTPASPQSLQVTIAAAPPQLLNVTVQSNSATSFVVAVSGYATTRSLSSLTFQFTPAANYSLATTSFTVDVSAAATAWYSTSSSQNFGGQFLVSVPFSASATGTVTSPSTAIMAISVTATNGQGTSNSISSTGTP